MNRNVIKIINNASIMWLFSTLKYKIKNKILPLCYFHLQKIIEKIQNMFFFFSIFIHIRKNKHKKTRSKKFEIRRTMTNVEFYNVNKNWNVWYF